MMFTGKLYAMVCKVSLVILLHNTEAGGKRSFDLRSLSPQTHFSHITIDENPNLMAVLEPALLKQTSKQTNKKRQKKLCVIQTAKE